MFLISALRAIVEMLALCLFAQGFLYFLAGQKRKSNPIYQLFAVITHGPCRLVSKFVPVGTSAKVVGIVCFAVLLLLWIGLAILRKSV
jgi:ABC-type multidrug transport system permease subunit